MDKLLNCPCCGRRAEYIKYQSCDGYKKDGYTHKIVCECGLSVTGISKETVFTAWNRRFEQPNEPLTIDELRQMDGEPVYCIGQDNNGLTDWGLVNITEERIYDNVSDWWEFGEYGITFVAYRRKPERKEK